MNPPFIAVISAGRAQNVPLMLGHLNGLEHTWVVPAGQEEDYRYAGAPSVIGTHSTQDTHQRNFALDVAGYRYCIQTDDDLRALHFTMPGSNSKAPIPFAMAVDELVKACEKFDAYYAGVAPTDNAYFTRQMYHLSGFIRSALIAIRPGSGIRFDHALPLKADYDFTLQMLAKYGKVARVDSLLASFAFGQGSGGCVAYRTPELEQECIAYLMRKWPGRVVENPKRPNEVLLRWKAEPDVSVVERPKKEAPGTGQTELW